LHSKKGKLNSKEKRIIKPTYRLNRLQNSRGTKSCAPTFLWHVRALSGVF
jgi:hypothetical protein